MSEQLTTMSFYRYDHIKDPEALRLKWFESWSEKGVIGRIYVSTEGFNAQLSVPTEHKELLQKEVEEDFPGMRYKIALEEQGIPFKKLKIKVREKIVADGLNDDSFDVTNVGTHLSAEEFDKAAQDGALIVDLRNHYECEIGHFKGAYLPEGQTFREVLPEVEEKFQDEKDRKVLLYCTGGIRCEKASAYFKHRGFKDVNQLHGGIIAYADQVKQEGRESQFIGKNFVFDDRLGERVTEDVLSNCHQCGTQNDEHTNCPNPGCNLLFIQCPSCKDKFEGYCSYQCRDIVQLPREEQIKIQQRQDEHGYKFYRSRRKQDLKQIAEQYEADVLDSDTLVPPSLEEAPQA